MSTALLLFRRDLRLVDQPALAAACAAHDRVLPVYLHAPHEEAPWQPGAASRWWLHHALEALQQRLAAQGAELHIAHGDSLPMLRALIAASGAEAAPYFRVFNPCTQAAKFDPQASYLKRWLPELATLPAKLLHEPWRDPGALAACGYPAPMADLGATREAALRAWQALPPR